MAGRRRKRGEWFRLYRNLHSAESDNSADIHSRRRWLAIADNGIKLQQSTDNRRRIAVTEQRIKSPLKESGRRRR